jgi:hypothetical protein
MEIISLTAGITENVLFVLQWRNCSWGTTEKADGD